MDVDVEVVDLLGLGNGFQAEEEEASELLPPPHIEAEINPDPVPVPAFPVVAVESTNSGLNPLLIPHILEKIIDYVGMEDLLSCRKVCGTWKSETRKMLQKKFVVKLNTLEQVTAYYDKLKDIPAEDFPHAMFQLGPLTRVKNYPGPLPIPAYRRRIENFPGDMPFGNPYNGYAHSCRPVLNNFFKAFGDKIKKLELHTEIEIPLADFRDYLANHTPNMEALSMTVRYNRHPRLFENDEPFYKPNLKTLSLRSNVEMVPISLLRDFFIMAPNVMKLTCLPLFQVRKYPCARPVLGRLDFIRVLFHTVAMAQNPPPLLNLTNLDINLQLTDTELQGLISKSFPLKFITLGICADVKGTTVSSLLNAGQNRLVRVALNFHPSSPAAAFRYNNVRLSKLNYLSLCSFKGSVAFVNNCPQLNTLVIAKCGNLSNTFPLPLYEVGPHSLQGLFLQWDTLSDPDIIHRITRYFPRLTSFSMKGGNDQVLREIYLTMPYLQKLTILSGEFTDEGVTGISEIVHKDIAESGSLSVVDPGKLRTNMSIATLSNLRKLRLQSALITDVSVFLGIGSCTNLQHLHLECPLLTDSCLWRVARFPHIQNLNLVSCAGLTLDWKMKLRTYLKAQGRNVHLQLETVEEVLLESQRRALILPDLSRQFYRFEAMDGHGAAVGGGAGGPGQAGAAAAGGGAVGGAGGAGGIGGMAPPGPPPNNGQHFQDFGEDSSDDDDDDPFHMGGGAVGFQVRIGNQQERAVAARHQARARREMEFERYRIDRYRAHRQRMRDEDWFHFHRDRDFFRDMERVGHVFGRGPAVLELRNQAEAMQIDAPRLPRQNPPAEAAGVAPRLLDIAEGGNDAGAAAPPRNAAADVNQAGPSPPPRNAAEGANHVGAVNPPEEARAAIRLPGVLLGALDRGPVGGLDREYAAHLAFMADRHAHEEFGNIQQIAPPQRQLAPPHPLLAMGPSNADDFPPPIPFDMDLLDDIEM